LVAKPPGHVEGHEPGPAIDWDGTTRYPPLLFKLFKDSMSLRDRLSEDLKLAMKARDQLRMDVIRMIKAAVLNKEVEMKKDLDDAEMSRIMTTMIKQRKESVEQYEKGQRAELAAKERQEISIIEAYLPKALSSDELIQTVDAVIRETGASSAKDMGAVMKAMMARLAGQPVDGKQVSDLVRSRLK
jgi:uncharacterized protein YqeY